jgi:ABC-2 type transport system permease protein
VIGAVIRSEWIKERTVRSNVVMAVVGIALPTLIAVLYGAFENYPNDGGNLDIVIGTGLITSLLVASIGVTTITGEYQYNTIRPTFTATPARRRVLVAKAGVLAVSALVIQAVQVGLAWAAVRAVQALRGIDVERSEPFVSDFDDLGNTIEPMLVRLEPVKAIIGILVLGVLLSMFGLALGMLIHHTGGALAALFVWVFVIENLLFAILSVIGVDRPQHWLPYQASLSLADTTTSSESRLWGGLYFGAWIAMLMIAGALRTERSDA